MNDSRWETSGAWKEPRRWIIAGWILLGESSNFTFRSFRQINLFSQIPLLYDVVSAEYLLCVLSVLGGASTRHRDVCMLFGQSHWYTNLASLFSLSSSLRLLPLSHGLFLPRPQNLRVQRSSSSRSQNNAKVSLAGCWPLNIQCPTTRRSPSWILLTTIFRAISKPLTSPFSTAWFLFPLHTLSLPTVLNLASIVISTYSEAGYGIEISAWCKR